MSMARNQLQTQKEIVTARGLYKDGIVVTEQSFFLKGIADVLIVFLEQPKGVNRGRGNAAAVWGALTNKRGTWHDRPGRAFVRNTRKMSETRRKKLNW